MFQKPLREYQANAWDRTLRSDVRRLCVACDKRLPQGAMCCPDHPTAAVRGVVL